MPNFASLILRVILGVIIIIVAWYILDTVHDRNTEILLGAVGFLYTQLSVMARSQRLSFFMVMYFFGKIWAHLRNESYDEAAANRIARIQNRFATTGLILDALLELLCGYRIFTSILGTGWDSLSAPIWLLIGKLTG